MGGWSDVVFNNHQIELTGNAAYAMGNYYFTSAEDGSKSKVEYTFGYKKSDDGKLRIFLHHSSVPYSSNVPAQAPCEEVSCPTLLAGVASGGQSPITKFGKFMQLEPALGA